MTGAELVIFDCDGVLVDSEPISIRVGRQILGELGWHLSDQEMASRFVGCSAEHFRREVAAGTGRTLGPGWEHRYAPRYRAAFDAELTAVPGVTGVLDALGVAGTAFCVASNSGHGHIEHVLTLAGLADRFRDRAFSAEEVAHGKPAPDLFLHAARRMGARPERTIVVEDSVYGVRAAHAAAMTCLAYAGGVTPAAALAAEDAVVFASMSELPALLDGSGPTGAGRDEVCA